MHKLIRWIKSLFVGNGGYRCDVCGEWKWRRDGRATVKRIEKDYPPLATLPHMTKYFTILACPKCAEDV